MNAYQQAVLDARKEQLKLIKRQEKALLKIYEESAKEVTEKLAKARTGSLSERHLQELLKSINSYTNKLTQELSKHSREGIKAAAEIAAQTQAAYFNSMDIDSSIKQTFGSMFANISDDVLRNFVSGNYYKDGLNLDQRVWNIAKKNGKDINRIISKGIVQQKSPGQLAKELEAYVNPSSKMKCRLRVPGINKKIAYQAQRLARTSITHAYNEGAVRSAKKNPFNIGLKWNLSSSHYERQVKRWGEDECDDYADKVFKPNDYPLSHPNCLCFSTIENMPLDQVGDELNKWVKGEKNPKLDKWFKKNHPEVYKKKDSPKKTKEYTPAKTIKEAEKFMKDNLGISNVSYKGIKVEVANQWNESIFNTLQKFPELKDNFDFIGTIQERNKYAKKTLYDEIMEKYKTLFPSYSKEELEPYVKKKLNRIIGKVSSKVYAQSTTADKIKGITVNTKFGKDPEMFRKCLKYDVESKFHPPGCEKIKSVVDHELGHQIDTLLGISEQENIKKLYKSLTENEITEGLSKYSWRNNNSRPIREFVAEGWSEYCNNSKPRPISKEIGETIERVYKEWKLKI